MKNQTVLVFLVLFVSIFLTRLVPHVPNFTIVSASILFTAIVFRKWHFLGFILLANFLCDIIINNWIYGREMNWLGSTTLFIYLPFILNFIIARFSNAKGGMATSGIVRNSFVSAVVFFIISNLGVFLTGTFYPKNITGFFACYTSAIPFFAYEFVGCLFFSVILFGVYGLADQKKLVPFELR